MTQWACKICGLKYNSDKTRTCEKCNTVYGKMNYKHMKLCRGCNIKYKLSMLRCELCHKRLGWRSWCNPDRPSQKVRTRKTEYTGSYGGIINA